MNDNFELFLRLKTSKAALVQAYYSSLDSSLIRSYLDPKQILNKLPILGEGRHFQSFKMTTRDGLSLAVNLAKQSFYGTEPVQRRRWTEDLKCLLQLDHPLVPPMEVFAETDYFAYVQPCCDSELTQSPEIRRLMLDLQESLQTLGLEMDDYPQLRSCQGHPFMIDYSELKRITHSGFKF